MTPRTAAELLLQLYPPLEVYPHLHEISAPQTAFLLLDQREAFYGGAAGGGKSDALLLAGLQYVDKPTYAGLLLRRTFPELEGADGLIHKSLDWLADWRQQGRCEWNTAKHRWTFESGAILQFGHVQNQADMFRYQGQAWHFVGFDELTHFTEEIYDYIAFTRSRRTKRQIELGIPVRARSGSNPGNIGHGWVKSRFVAKQRNGAIFVPARIRDNPGLDADTYEQDLSHLPEELRRQLMDGDWDAFEGAAYTVTDAHLVDTFTLEDSFERFEACDYGLNGAPWALIAVDFEGNLIFDDMLYKKNLLPSQLAPLVTEKRKAGWGHGHQAYADPSIWHRTGTLNKWGRPAMLADEFTDNGVPLQPANNDPRAGMMRLRELLELDEHHPFPSWHPQAGELGAPRVFFRRGPCDPLILELQSAPLQPIDKRDGGEIVNPDWESKSGHAAAMARYACLTRPSPSSEPPAPVEDERRALLDEITKRENERGSHRRYRSA